MGVKSDKRDVLGMNRAITRRDFCSGVSAAVLSTGLLSLPGCAIGTSPKAAATNASDAYYPPSLMGLRGTHPGAFEVAHALAGGRSWDSPRDQPGDPYDLVVVGGGISGLAAAYFYRERVGENARILVLDNHDDFGGHAKRNEFRVGSRLMIGYGGSQSIDSPGSYSPVAKKLIEDLAIDTSKFYRAYDRTFFSSRKLTRSIFFDRATYGVDRLVVDDPFSSWGKSVIEGDQILEYVDQLPVSADSREQLLAILTRQQEAVPEGEKQQVMDELKKQSFNDYLRERFGANDEVIGFFQKRTESNWGIGTDAISAMECLRANFPGFAGLGLEGCSPGHSYAPCDDGTDEPYIFHFPDGNASIARLMVRALIPDCCPGNTMEDIVTAKMDYGRLDELGAATQLRLNSTAVRVANSELPSGEPGIECTYVREGQAHRVRARHAVLACYNLMVPYLCAEIPKQQKEAIEYGVKMPLVYVSVLIRSWRAFQKIGVYNITYPNGFYHSISLDFPVSLGEYSYPQNPDEPMILHLTHVPTFPGNGRDARTQHRMGQHALLATSFETYERHVREQLRDALGPAGFDPKRDILGITVNRWPHGYTYEYNELFDPEWEEGRAPHEIGRQTIGRIAIANADAGASAYADVAIDQADRAVRELLAS